MIDDYAIGGAIGAAFYIKATQTEDIDAFVFLPPGGGLLVSLAPVYEALQAMGGVEEGPYVRFGNWPVQILTDGNSLIAEAIREALPVEYDGTPTRVFRPEYLCAIALQTGRGKDYLRVRMFFDQGAVDLGIFKDLLNRFDLSERMRKVPE